MNSVGEWLSKQKPKTNSNDKVISKVMGKPKKLKVRGK